VKRFRIPSFRFRIPFRMLAIVRTNKTIASILLSLDPSCDTTCFFPIDRKLAPHGYRDKRFDGQVSKPDIK
jgi:hypothetical protein